MRIIVAAAPGGGYDTYSHLIGRHMGKHIPGNPTFIVENMPGGGQLIAVNHIFKVVKPDGLTIGHFSGNLVINQVFDQHGVEFDEQVRVHWRAYGGSYVLHLYPGERHHKRGAMAGLKEAGQDGRCWPRYYN